MLLKGYRPRSKLVTQETLISRPRYPVIDAHNHLGDFGGGGEKRPIGELLDDMDAVDVRVYVDLDGGWGEDILERHLDSIKSHAPDRFMVFGGVDWSQWPTQGSHFVEWAAGRLRAQARRGAQGLKIWKPLGLSVRDDQGLLVRVDDERLDPNLANRWRARIFPVLIHVADPVAFFDPVDETNERWEELGARGLGIYQPTRPIFPIHR